MTLLALRLYFNFFPSSAAFSLVLQLDCNSTSGVPFRALANIPLTALYLFKILGRHSEIQNDLVGTT